MLVHMGYVSAHNMLVRVWLRKPVMAKCTTINLRCFCYSCRTLPTRVHSYNFITLFYLQQLALLVVHNEAICWTRWSRNVEVIANKKL